MRLQETDNSRFCRDLTLRLIPEAAGTLKSLIGLNGNIPNSEIIIGQTEGLHYNRDYRAICVPSELIYSSETDLFVSVGEELTHYLHHQARPEVFEALEEARTAIAGAKPKDACFPELISGYLTVYNYIESVGQYAGLLLAEQNLGSDRVMHHINTMLSEQISDACRKLRENGFKNFESKWEALAHMSGYTLAGSIFERDKDMALAELFFLPHEQFSSLCERYGVRSPRLVK